MQSGRWRYVWGKKWFVYIDSLHVLLTGTLMAQRKTKDGQWKQLGNELDWASQTHPLNYKYFLEGSHRKLPSSEHTEAPFSREPLTEIPTCNDGSSSIWMVLGRDGLWEERAAWEEGKHSAGRGPASRRMPSLAHIAAIWAPYSYCIGTCNSAKLGIVLTGWCGCLLVRHRGKERRDILGAELLRSELADYKSFSERTHGDMPWAGKSALQDIRAPMWICYKAQYWLIYPCIRLQSSQPRGLWTF